MEEEEARQSKKPRGAACSGLTAFALRMAKRLADGVAGAGGGSAGQANLVFSPVSIYAALALVAAGARGGTLDELLTLLGAASRDELARAAAGRALARRSGPGAPLIAFGCGLWHDETVALTPAYRAAARESYDAETRAADFKRAAGEAMEEINSWVSEATNNLITSILPPGSVHSDTALVLANAVYFKGRWSMPFDAKDTGTGKFRRLDGSHVRAPFMRGRRDHAVAEHEGFKVLKLAYLPYRLPHWQDRYLSAGSHGRRRRRGDGGGSGEGSDEEQRARFSMCVFLPDARDGLPDLLEKMASAPGFLWDHLPEKRVETGDVRLPKFKLSFSGEINGVLEAMGMRAAFDAGKADLSDMLEGEGRLVVEHVFHRAVIEVDEEGTEAAASTACTMTLICKRRRVDFVADHPFAFFVVEEVSSTVVFMGHVLDPTSSE